MKSSIRPVYAAASIAAAAGILAAGLALKPAFAVSGSLSPDTACNSSSPCKTYKNSGLGAGLQGINTNNSPFGSALIGTATKFGSGVSGTSVGGFGVNGTSTNATGVSGTGASFGTFGFSTNGDGVEGQSTNSAGVVGFSSNWVGIQGASSSSVGVLAIGSSAAALEAVGSTGDGVDIFAGASVGAYISNSGGAGADINGSSFGAVVRAPDCNTPGYPWVATDQVGNNLGWIDCTGTIFAHNYGTFSRTRGGAVVTTFTPKSATPTIEDNGTAKLVGGVAAVSLDATFARSIDSRQTYQVMLTPDGDTRGLFIASKSPSGFVVREVQGGRGTLSFDYHIYATSLGQAGQRMTELTPAQSAAMMPHAQVVTRKALKATIKTLHPH